jgi:hypothetical protein
MQHEIEALLKAFLQEKKREAQLVQDVLTALAVGSVMRHQMIEAIAGAVDRAAPELVTPRPPNQDDIALAVGRLRAARDAANVH